MAQRAVHRRIAADIQARITDGHWQPGDQLPSRVQLAADYGVHPQTIRLAVTLLRQQGVLEGTPRRRLYVAYPPAVRALTDPDAPWPHGSDTLSSRRIKAASSLAARLDVRPGAALHEETQECWDPGGKSAMLITTWWRGRRQEHVSTVVEVDTVRLDEAQAHALGLTVDAVAYRLVRTRLNDEGCPVETADLILPMDRWRLRFTL